MSQILFIYSTTDGHTLKICQTMGPIVEMRDHQVEIISIDNVSIENMNSSDKIIIGASIRYGKHNKNVYDFIERYLEILKTKPGAFFTVNVTARKPDKNRPENNPYMIKFLDQIPWQPDRLAVFAGKIDYQKYGWFDRFMIRLIMYITKGPTDLNTVAEFTNWQDVEAFANTVSEM